MSDNPKRILVVDDEHVVREIIVETLIDEGHDVLQAPSGDTALLLLDDPDDIAALVTDLHMPGMVGVELARRAREKHPDLPILFLSGRLDVLVASNPPKPFSGLQKPFRLEDLRKAVARLLQDDVAG
jgi:CheY-like chemotaxis protein